MIVPRLSGQELGVFAALAVAPLVGRVTARLARRLAADREARPADDTPVDGSAVDVPAVGGSGGGVSWTWIGVGWAVVALSAGLAPPGLLVATLGLGWTLLLLAAVDIATLRLPDGITLPLCGLGLVLGGVAATPLGDRCLGLVAGGASLAVVDLIYVRLRGRSGIGLGDAKLFGAAGAWLGWRLLPSVLLLACAGGLAWVAVRVLVKGRSSASAPLPFGAPLCAAFWAVWLQGAATLANV